ncbi:protein serine/threonine phosphatase 2C [Epithele typhae]|uniref:protein serine/threonine phosphatase 2C n=1 Tax=Epithele typhae TaxID=378194 RepID=UPI002007678A|nr:protein serine/threonine phosphatase 2C [Epithele typhae]KAH9942305.1 protein serine/threonine phosphatase 2C [Epithele typhae]
MGMRVITLTPATSQEQQRALEEVKDFALTDMDRGGQERWTYRMLQEPALTEHLERIAEPRTFPSTSNPRPSSSALAVDAVSFQPCRSWHHRSQDRYVVEEWPLPGGSWTYTAVFDGHMNHDAVDHVSAVVGPLLRRELDAALRAAPSPSCPPNAVADLLRRTLERVDADLISAFTSLFPADPTHADPSHAHALLNDKGKGPGDGAAGHWRAARAFGGSTALVALVDPTQANLWVANIGDCVAVLAEKDGREGWRGTVLNVIHNGGNPQELARIRSEHPDEPECTWNDRVLGFLAPTRALGDAWLKLPAPYAALVFGHLDADWLAAEAMAQHVPRIRSPPYLSAAPDVYHRALDHGARVERVLVLASDGLSDLYDGCAFGEMAREWAGAVGGAADAGPSPGGRRANLALALLREAIGGADAQLVSRTLTVEMEERWMDDTTIVALRLS